MSKILLLIHSGYELIETLTAVDVLRALDLDLHVCSVDNKTLKSLRDVYIQSDISFSDIHEEDYSCVIIPGGPSAEELKKNKKVIKLVQNFNEKGKLIGAICGAPQILSEAGILINRTATSHPKVKDNIICKEYSEKSVVKDNNIITSRSPGTAMEFAFTLAKELCPETDVNELKKHFLI